ncbi:hypothetical protein ACLQ2S_25850 [Micromonospora sp. DT48]|uniref:WXG100-like domain-containing protein n=1 Tax=unclassified Micromonospora TaxID=2617518 RepID=UPI0012BD0506|nr:hypothetical protein [Micromonospora sp. CP22]MTK04962.1 hypothetical protein [Micromonospora sp. CP22]
MSDDYYGWRPVSHPYAGITDDYAAERASQASPYEPTAWDSVNIEQMWEYVRKESDERTTALADMWRRAASLLQTTRDNLKRHADALDARWQSPAARVFMGRVGATLHSLDEWKEIATNNAAGLDQLASKIETAQRDMKELWQEYQAEQTRQGERRRNDEGFQASDLVDWIPGVTGNDGKSYEDVQKEFHQRAKNITKPLADMYIDVYIHNISRGGKFKGPTDAVIVAPTLAPGGPRPPGAPRPGAPVRGAAPNRPDMPNRPNLPTRPGGEAPAQPTTPPPPNPPDGVGLAGGAAAPVAPPPTAPPVTTAPNAPAAPGPAVPPVAPPGPRPVNPNLTTPNSARPNAPRTTLPGSGGPGAPGSRGPAPNRPTLPGAGGPGSGSGAPGGGRRGTAAPNRPTLPGNTGTGAPGGGRGRPGMGGRPGAPTTPPASSPRLPGSTAARPGQRGTTPGRPTAPPPSLGGQRGATPASPARPGSPLTGKPATGKPTTGKPLTGGGTAGPRPDLGGRTGAGTGRPAPTTGPAPSLGGRRGGPTAPPPRKAAPRDDAEETWEYGDGDDELWVTESSAVGVVEAPAEHRPREQGKALGQN